MSRYYLKRASSGDKYLRITISLDGAIKDRLLEIQQNFLSHTGEEWSMSKIINMVLLGGISADQKLGIHDWNTIKRFTDGRSTDISEIEVGGYVTNIVALRQTSLLPF